MNLNVQIAAVLFVACPMVAFSARAIAAPPSTAEARSQVAAQNGVSPSDVVIKGIVYEGQQIEGDRIVEKYRIDYEIRTRGEVAGQGDGEPFESGITPERQEAYADVSWLVESLHEHFDRHECFPPPQEGLRAVEVDDDRLVDPWGNPYRYEVVSPEQVRIVSSGPDGEPDTSDDIQESAFGYSPIETSHDWGAFPLVLAGVALCLGVPMLLVVAAAAVVLFVIIRKPAVVSSTAGQVSTA